MRPTSLFTAAVLAVAASTAFTAPASAAPRDSDHDGMSNTWEIAHHLNPHRAADARADNDHDGLFNRWEFRLGDTTNITATTETTAATTTTTTDGEATRHDQLGRR